MSAPALFAIDFDGTVLRSDGSITDRTATAIRATLRVGCRVLVVTGRPPRWLDPVADLLDRQGTAVAANGALVVDLASRSVVDSHHLALDDAAEVLRRLRDALPAVAFGVERTHGFAHEAAYPRGVRRSEQASSTRAVTSDAELLAEPPIKILARITEQAIDDAAGQAIAALDGLACVYFSGTDLLEIAPAGVSKASALAQLAGEWGVGRDRVVAIGDMPNDIPMLEWAGLGVAVANAHPEVRAVADEITASNDDDGVAIVLERFLAATPR